MPANEEPKPIAIDAHGLTQLLAAMTIEIVAALHPLHGSPEQTLTDIANALLERANRSPFPEDAELVRHLARNLISTERSGLE